MTDIDSIIRRIHAQASQLGACDRFRGDETLDELIALMKSPQGIEFCTARTFPNLSTVRLFRERDYDLRRWEVYLDAGQIRLSNPEHAVLIGRTVATVDCDTTDPHTVTLMHGAKAILNASRWAVVKVNEGRGSFCFRNTADNAIIL